METFEELKKKLDNNYRRLDEAFDIVSILRKKLKIAISKKEEIEDKRDKIYSEMARLKCKVARDE